MRFIATLAHFFYDEELLSFTRQNTANYITILGAWLSRLGLLILLVTFCLFLAGHELTFDLFVLRWVGIGLSSLGAICDGLDGWIARRLGIVSPFGELYDSHADKVQYLTKLGGITIDTALIVLSGASPIFFVQVILIAWISFERDATSMFHRAWALREAPGVKISAGSSGKWRTRICFPGILVFHLILNPIGSPLLGWIDTALIMAATAWSNYDYVRTYRHVIKTARRAHP
ncbi:CDP-alcohol phosphatidyltransferase family protein [Candidatus Uhrbacteria bacterium]|nr:CDP-alcohol phosphatidyltransferase family protein [Candidatus Uhrbacteria bacterium]